MRNNNNHSIYQFLKIVKILVINDMADGVFGIEDGVFGIQDGVFGI